MASAASTVFFVPPEFIQVSFGWMIGDRFCDSFIFLLMKGFMVISAQPYDVKRFRIVPMVHFKIFCRSTDLTRKAFYLSPAQVSMRIAARINALPLFIRKFGILFSEATLIFISVFAAISTAIRARLVAAGSGTGSISLQLKGSYISPFTSFSHGDNFIIKELFRLTLFPVKHRLSTKEI